ncbi:DNA cytosine methyltransferase [Bradyrhizobium sp. CCGB12]|uniref:DNA cytosine methyltransferase n=1 Tax=Bradyrhizobium sp. CCGB12 TaxID=2949632 RepID=UPI0020B313C8|nr:DNA cytosine methyltransferase [Bradyrhizobium sp. CCGB12]MCP3391529.1 DNA cytosine methyltransferase [Bradyrhizobium sp. CCGB12]
MKITAVDIFCGIGGLSYGFKQEGIEVVAGFDSDPSCKFAFEANVGGTFNDVDVKALTGAKLKKFLAKDGFRVLIGCAPCQPFSSYTKRYRKKVNNSKQDTRWQLLTEFARLVKETKPDVVSMENVPSLVAHPIFQQFVDQLKALGYHVTYARLRAERYGVPQRRTRLVVFASRFGAIEIPKETHAAKPVTVREAIGKLPRIKAGEACSTDRIHFGRGLSPINLKRIQATREGGSWKDWDEELQLKCHKKQKGKSFRSVYGRMRWNEPSPVITTQCLGIGNGRFGHPLQDRGISIREAALLQSFPKKFLFAPAEQPINQLVLARQIGNAVPVRLGRVIARAIKGHLKAASKNARAAA